jgi:hypothetical protein
MSFPTNVAMPIAAPYGVMVEYSFGVSHQHLRAIIGRVWQRPVGFPAAYSLRTHIDGMHLGLAVFMVPVVVCAPGVI